MVVADEVGVIVAVVDVVGVVVTDSVAVVVTVVDDATVVQPVSCPACHAACISLIPATTAVHAAASAACK